MKEKEKDNGSHLKRPVWQWLLLYSGVVIVLCGLFYFSVLPKNGKESSAQSLQSTTMMQKFSDSNDFKNAYKIFPGNLSEDTKKALIGFDFKKNSLPSGSTEISLVAKKQGYTTQTLTVKSGESVYFIESFGLDDNQSQDTDNGLKDDKAVIVDSNGYLVNK